MADTPKKRVKNTGSESSYTAQDIFVLEGLDPVRKRPGMYIGTTGPEGLHHLVWEVVDNSIDEAMAGHAANITVELFPDGRVAVADDGRGIPVDVHKQTKKSALETVLTTLHAGGKFGGNGYKVSGGLHGVGVSVVNALSSSLRVEVIRDGYLHAQEYARGVPTGPVKKVRKADGHGTKVIFLADPTIFSVIEYDRKKIMERLRNQAYLTRGIRIVFIDYREEVPYYYGFRFDGGLRAFVEYLNEGGDPFVQDEIFHIEKEVDGVHVEVALAYTEGFEVAEWSFANNINTVDGGTHLTGFRSALTRTLNDYGREKSFLKNPDDNLAGDDVREGLVAAVSVKLPEPQFEGQTKTRLGTPSVRGTVETLVAETFREFLEKHGSDGKRILEK
ncbi:MAG: ATP-binding protein, partial [Candidatus Thermoplasmatota archaeon]